MFRKFLVLPFLFFFFHSFGQTFSATGIVQNRKDNSPLLNANIILTPENSTLSFGSTTEQNGRFNFGNLKPDHYELKISYLGFQTFTKQITISNQDLDLGIILLSEKNIEMKEIEVTAKAPTMIQKGDTTELNAASFKVNADANADELIQKMPGITVDNGKVQAQGEDVKQVLVDGKPFFGNDPNAALKNLPAEIIDKIQIYDEKSDQSQFTGFDDGNTSKTLNVVTKINRRNGQFGKGFAGAGNEDRYSAGASVNIFKQKTRLTVIGQSNNINIQNFSIADILGSGGFGGRRFGSGFAVRAGGMRALGNLGGNAFNNFSDLLVNQKSGLTKTNAVGINFSDQWENGWDVSGSYFFNQSRNQSMSSVYRDYVTESVYNESDNSNSENYNHRLNMKINYDFDDQNSFLLRPRLTFQDNNSDYFQNGILSSSGAATNSSDNSYSADGSGFNFSNDFLLRHKFETKGRTVSVNVSLGVNQSSSANTQQSINNYFAPSFNADSLNQFSDQKKNDKSISADLTYTEPAGENGQWLLSYENSYQKNSSDKKSFENEATNSSTTLDSSLSNAFATEFRTTEIGTGYNYKLDAFSATVKLGYQWQSFSHNQDFPFSSLTHYQFQKLMPNVNISYRFENNSLLRVMYRGTTSIPSVSQLQNVLDNSNPLLLSIGNPNLDPVYQHNLTVRYGSIAKGFSNIFFILFNASYSDNFIGNNTFTASGDTLWKNQIPMKNGVQITQPENLGRYFSLRTFINYGLPVEWLGSNLNFNLSGSFSDTPGKVNDQYSESKTSTVGFGSVLSSNISEELDFTFTGNATYSRSDYSLNKSQNSESINSMLTGKLNWIFGDGFVFQTDISNQNYSGLSDSYNQNIVLWNAGIGKKFFEKKQGELKFSVYDILNRNSSVQRNYSETYFEDSKTNSLQRFFLLTFTYNFRYF